MSCVALQLTSRNINFYKVNGFNPINCTLEVTDSYPLYKAIFIYGNIRVTATSFLLYVEFLDSNETVDLGRYSDCMLDPYWLDSSDLQTTLKKLEPLFYWSVKKASELLARRHKITRTAKSKGLYAVIPLSSEGTLNTGDGITVRPTSIEVSNVYVGVIRNLDKQLLVYGIYSSSTGNYIDSIYALGRGHYNSRGIVHVCSNQPIPDQYLDNVVVLPRQFAVK